MRNQVRAHAAVGEIHQVKSGCARGKGEVGDADKIPVADAVVMLLQSIQRAPQQTGVDLAVATVRSAESEPRPEGTQVDPNAVARIKMPADFAARLNGILTPGATLFVTNEALYPQTSGPMLQVVDADPPTKSPKGQKARKS